MFSKISLRKILNASLNNFGFLFKRRRKWKF